MTSTAARLTLTQEGNSGAAGCPERTKDSWTRRGVWLPTWMQHDGLRARAHRSGGADRSTAWSCCLSLEYPSPQLLKGVAASLQLYLVFVCADFLKGPAYDCVLPSNLAAIGPWPPQSCTPFAGQQSSSLSEPARHTVSLVLQL